MGRAPGRKLTSTTGLRLGADLLQALESLAAKEDRAVAQVIRVLLREALAERALASREALAERALAEREGTDLVPREKRRGDVAG
jgi:hypothetical protein